jgi:hypothetical protein
VLVDQCNDEKYAGGVVDEKVGLSYLSCQWKTTHGWHEAGLVEKPQSRERKNMLQEPASLGRGAPAPAHPDHRHNTDQ